jgi:hypothetical protein
MKTNNMLLKLGVAGLAVALGAATVIACSSSSNPAPETNLDAGGSSSGSSSSGSSGGGSSSGGSSSGSSSGATDGGADTSTACVNDAGAMCSSCATLPSYNVCSPYFTTGCIPFNNSVVPTHPTL